MDAKGLGGSMQTDAQVPIAHGVPTDQGSSSGAPPIAVATAVPLDIPQAIPTFEVVVPNGMGPGSAFMIQVGRAQHEIVVPEGAHGGQTLTCMIVPRNCSPGMEVIVQMKMGEMAVTIPSMAPGEVLIVDVGTGLEQYVEQEPWAPMEMLQSNNRCCRNLTFICAIASVLVLFSVLLSSLAHPHHPPYGGGYGGGYGAQPVHPGVSQYQSHLLANSHVLYGASPPPPIAPIDPSIDPDDFPGKEDGFERGVDESGAEVYRYEQNNQVYIIPANDYYAWRSEHYHGHLTSDILSILLISHLYHRMIYPHGMYYGAGGMYRSFGMAHAPYYASAAYQSHFSTPVRGANGQVAYPRAAAGGATAGAARAGTPVAQARPIGSARPASAGAAGGRVVGTPTASARPVSRPAGPTAQARPIAQPRPVPQARPTGPIAQARPASGGWNTARSAYRPGGSAGGFRSSGGSFRSGGAGRSRG